MSHRRTISPESNISLQTSGKSSSRKNSRKVAKNQSTLTQLHAVLFPYGRQETEIVGVSSDDETYEEIRPKKRRRIASKTSRRDDTLTQRHGFSRLMSSFECGDSEEETQFQEQPRDTVAGRVSRLKERNAARTAENIQPASLMADQNPEIKAENVPEYLEMPNNSCRPDLELASTTCLSACPRSSISTQLRTPRKSVRFATEQVIPSSQTPSDAGIYTQRSIRYRDVERSPLKDKSGNIRFSTPRNRKQADVTDDSEFSTPLREPRLRASQAAGKSGSISDRLSKCSAKAAFEMKENELESFELLHNGSEILQCQALQPDIEAVQYQPERIRANTTRCTQLPCSHRSQLITKISRPQKRGSLQRVSTIQDSDSEDFELDEVRKDTDKHYEGTTSEKDSLTQYTLRNPSTYDPVNSALDRDAARFLQTQRFQSQRRLGLGTEAQPTQPTLLQTKSTVEDSDEDQEDILADEDHSTDDEVVEIVPGAASPLLGESPPCKTGARHGALIESQLTLVADDPSLDLVRVSDSQTQTETVAASDTAETDQHDLSRIAVPPVQESHTLKAASEIYDSGQRAAAARHKLLRGQHSSLTEQTTQVKVDAEPQPKPVALTDTAEVVLSSQPAERHSLPGDEAMRTCTEVDRVPSSPPILRSSQVSTVVPTQWSQRQSSSAELQAACDIQLNQDISSLSQTIPSSPISYPWALSNGGITAHYERTGQLALCHDKDARIDAQSVDLAEFSLAPPPEWRPGTLTMSSSPIIVPPRYSSQNVRSMQGIAGQDIGELKTQGTDLEDFSLPRPSQIFERKR